MFIDLIIHGYLFNQIIFIKFNYAPFIYLTSSIMIISIFHLHSSYLIFPVERYFILGTTLQLKLHWLIKYRVNRY